MAGERKENFERKPMGKKMVTLVKDIQKQFLKKFSFIPSIVDVTDMIAERIIKVGGINIS